MKTIKLFTRPDDKMLNRESLRSIDFTFSTCSEIKDGVATSLTKFAYCRETVVGYFARFFNKLFDNKYLESELMYNTDANVTRENHTLYKHKDTPMKKASVAIHVNTGKTGKTYTDSLDRLVRNSVKLLNHYERRNKWFLSEVYKTDHDVSKTDVIYLFKSSKWWMTSTHTYSLYLLLIRLGMYEHFGKIEKSTSNSEMLSLLNMVDKDQRDGYYVSRGQPKMWNILLDNRKEIYGERSREDNFAFLANITAKTDGITSLCSNYATNESVRKKFAILCKSAKVKFESS